MLATGGGAFMNAETRRRIRETGVSVWLRADLPVLLRRVLKRDTRPLLRQGNPEATMKALIDARYPVYAEADVDAFAKVYFDPKATQEEIKQAYRRLVKRYHPDSQLESADSETTIRLNAAYEVLSDPQRRRSYDRREYQGTANPTVTREQRTASAQQQYQQQRQSEQGSDRQQKQWQKQVYIPIKRLIAKILSPLTAQIDQLAADPFDDDLL
ncbi:MAG: DnaJ domain-containing protein, partial [Hyphomonadaceae bacterium]|nr:DnaJ domain-containing protein [Hyphomonadaceae bacterium]